MKIQHYAYKNFILSIPSLWWFEKRQRHPRENVQVWGCNAADACRSSWHSIQRSTTPRSHNMYNTTIRHSRHITFNASRSTQSFGMPKWHTGHCHHWRDILQPRSRSHQSLIVTFDCQRQYSGGHSRCHRPRRWRVRCIDGRNMRPWRCLVWIYGGVPLRSWWV